MKFILAKVLMLVSAASAFGQSTEKAAPDTANNDKLSVFSVGASYGNTANYYGQTTAEKLPFVSTDLSYQSGLGFFVAGSAIKLVDLGPAVSELNLSVGYSMDITKKLGASASYTRFFFAKDSPLPQSVNPNTVSAGLTYDFKWLNSALNGDYVFGNVKDEEGRRMNDYYLTLSNSKEIDLGSIIKDKDYITITPSVSFIAGTQFLATPVSPDNDNNSESDGKKSTGKAPGFSPKDIINEVKSQEKKVNRIKKIGGKDTSPQYIYSTSFDLFTSTLRLPLAYNRAHYTLEAAYQLSIPSKKFAGVVHENQSFFTLSFTYLFYKDK
ncbi:hypothetical protein [Desertivirga brevis]|uniref:hypothetical protein n=1 Tax=Desertivirga brevis TaxID=2810310 RepID=UPI001A96BD6F|nr:hypothetical protein [Pedobacter sp. SYSU D00873]